MLDEILVKFMNDMYLAAQWIILSIKHSTAINLLGFVINIKSAVRKGVWVKIQYVGRLRTMMLVTNIIDPQWTNLTWEIHGVTHTHTCKEIVLTRMNPLKFYSKLSPNYLAQNKLDPLLIRFRLPSLKFKRTWHQWNFLFSQLSIVDLQKAPIDLVSRTYQMNHKGTLI